MNYSKLAQSMGWFSLGLGITQLVAPRLFTRTLGTNNRTGLVRGAYGLREIASGVGILASPLNPAPWMWARVAGDAVDLITLGKAHTPFNRKKSNVKAAMLGVAAITALDVMCAKELSRM